MTREELTEVWPVMSVAEIARRFGVTDQTVYSRARMYGLPARNAKSDGDGPEKDDPTPEQIKERSEAIKSSWTEEQRALRCVDKRRIGYTLQCYSSSAMFGQTESVAYSRI